MLFNRSCVECAISAKSGLLTALFVDTHAHRISNADARERLVTRTRNRYRLTFWLFMLHVCVCAVL